MTTQHDPYTYLQTFDGDAEGYLDRRKNGGQRSGQAFFNSLNDNDQWILMASPEHNPFHHDDMDRVRSAVEYLVAFGS